MQKLLLATVVSCVATWAAAQTPQQIVQKFYPRYSSQFQCRIAEEKKQGTYCMKLMKTETRDTAQGRLMYLAFSGNLVDLATGEESGSHANTGLAGVFVLKETAPNDWALLAAQPTATVGSSGYGPKEWSLHEFGPDKWGFLTEHGDVHQGYRGRHYVLFVHDGGKRVDESWLGGSWSNTGALGDCSQEETAKARKACLNKLGEQEATLKIRRDMPTVQGYYPIDLTLSGFTGRKKYRNQHYTAVFNTAKKAYLAPKNYPLRDIDY